jgi:DUF1680 family protein
MHSRRSFLQSLALTGAAAVAPVALIAGESRHRVEEFSYGDVSLDPGPASTLAQNQFENTQSVLMVLNEDSLLKPFRLRAGLPAPGPDLGGWYDEVPGPLRKDGHGFAPAHCFGQWISALCRGYAVTGDSRIRARVQRLLALYGAAISPRFYQNFRFPSYDYDKIVLGLVDAHRYAHIPEAFALLDRTTDAAEPSMEPRAIDRGEAQRQWRASVGQPTTEDYTWDEPYTLAENLWIAADAGAGERYRRMAPRYLLDRNWFDPLSENRNVLAGHHAYSFCNSLSSAMRTYLATGNEKYLRAGSHGFDMVDAQSFATGGWGPDESFVAPGSGKLCASLTDTHHSFETPCGSYAHFKLTRYLLRVTGDGRYGDSMERVFYNTVLGAKRLQADGHAFYYSDYNFSGSRFYYTARWPCCSGTLPQDAADYHILGYFRDPKGIYVNLYLPSALRAVTPDGAHLTLSQTGDYPFNGAVGMHLRLSRPSAFVLRLRIPAWSRSPQVRVNGSPVPLSIHSGFAMLRRRWADDDRVDLLLDLPLWLQAIDPEHPDTVALLRGPLVLFGINGNGSRVTRQQLLAARRLPGESATWSVQTGAGEMRLSPFTRLWDDPYTTYFKVA